MLKLRQTAATRGWYCPGSQDFDVEAAKIYRRECLRVEMALQQAAQLNQEAGGGLETVLLLHFPPKTTRDLIFLH
mgnify:CR=1 FL=1